MKEGDIVIVEASFLNNMGSTRAKPLRKARVLKLYPRFYLVEFLKTGTKECIPYKIEKKRKK